VDRVSRLAPGGLRFAALPAGGRGRSRGAHVQPGYLAVAAMREMADEICGQTLAAMLRMRADAAQLRIAPRAAAARRPWR
jgi:hypothetical protein